jgi:hypothetical protein
VRLGDPKFHDWCEAVQVASLFIGKMHTKLCEKSGERFAIKYRIASEEDCELEKQRCFYSFNFRTHFTLKPGKYTYLCEDDEFIMSDTPTEIYTNTDFLTNAKGDVLIGGLGLGIMPLVLLSLGKCNSITIIEKEQEIIDLVSSQLKFDERVQIIRDNIFTHVPTRKYDTIYHDIWTDISNDSLKEMEILEEKYKKFLKPSGWIGCWRQLA